MRQNLTRVGALIVFTLYWSGCGTARHVADDGGQHDGTAIVDSTIRSDGSAADALPPKMQCFAAVRFTRCCPVAEAATGEMIDADPCLVRWQGEANPLMPKNCTPPPHSGLCDPSPCYPPYSTQSRVVVSTGAAGMSPPPDSDRLVPPLPCQFAHECTTDNECTMVYDSSDCCGCPQGVPLWMRDIGCLHESGKPAPCKPLGDCGICNCDAATPKDAFCVQTSGRLRFCALKTDLNGAGHN